MRLLVAVVLVLTSPGLECTQALAAVENSKVPERLPVVAPPVSSTPKINVGLDAAPPAPTVQPVLGEPATAKIEPVIAPSAAPEAAPALSNVDAATPGEGIDRSLETRQAALADALDAPEGAASPDELRRRADIFSGSRVDDRGWLGKVVGIVTGPARRSFAAQKFSAALLDPSVPAADRARAARLLGDLKRRETIEALGETAAFAGDLAVRESARRSLKASEEKWKPILMKELRLHPLTGRRSAAARSLGWFARFSDDAAIVDVLGTAAAVDINHDVRLTAIHELSNARSARALAALIDIRRLAVKPDIVSAAEVAMHAAIANQQAAGRPVPRHHPAPGEFGSSKQPLYALALKRVIAVSAVFTAIEFIGGLMTGSLSLKADSAHLLADLGINVGALFALWMSRRPPNSHKTYGYLKMESLTGLLSAVAIAGMAVFTLAEAVAQLGPLVASAGIATVAAGLVFAASSEHSHHHDHDDREEKAHAAPGSLWKKVAGLAGVAGLAALTVSLAAVSPIAAVAVPALTTIALAFSGLLSNAISTALLYRYQGDNLSLKGAFLHAATDAIGSVGIIIAGALMYFFHWTAADPLFSLAIVGLILHTTWDLAKRSWNVLIDAVPPGVHIEELEGDLLAVPGVASVYDLHVWSLNSSEKALTAILYVKPDGNLEDALAAAKAVVREKHGIGHATLQVEYLKPPR